MKARKPTAFCGFLIICLLFSLAACGGKTEAPPALPPTASEASVLVAYFSATGNTKKVAGYVAEATGGTLFEIVPAEPYTAADLDYGTDCRADREQNDPSARPGISGAVESMAEYDVVYLGYPIWWGEAPKIIYTFLESYDFTGKTIVPFCTSGSSPIGSSAEHMHTLAGDANWLAGWRFAASATERDVENQING